MQYRKLSELTKLEGNPRTITKKDMDRLVTSIKDNADYFEARPLILSDRTGKLVILGGNQRYEAAKLVGLKEVPTHLIENLTLEREQEIIIRDNVSNGEWDTEELANAWSDLPLDEWGIDLPAGFGDEEVEEDEAPEVSSEPPVSQLGSIYQLGRHRVMCGDSTDIDDVERLMNSEKADMVFTDPPYGVDFSGAKYNPRAKNWEGIKNDKLNGNDLSEFIAATFFNITSVSNEATPVYVWSAPLHSRRGLLC